MKKSLFLMVFLAINFHGIEFNFGFRLNNIRAEFQMPIFNKVKSIEGLTDTQFLFSIKFVGGFTLKLKDESEATTGK